MTESQQRGQSVENLARRPCCHCGALCGVHDPSCWFCHHPPFERIKPPRAFQFSIATVLLFTLQIAICLAAFRLSPMLGIALGFWLIPASIRTLIAIEQHRGRVPRLSPYEKGMLAGSSLLVAGIACAAGSIVSGPAFIVTYVVVSGRGLAQPPPNDHRLGVIAAVVIATVVAFTIGSIILWLGRPSKMHRHF